MALPLGQKAPDFTLPSTSGRDFTLNIDFKGKACVIYFYPKDFTRICTVEACEFRDHILEFNTFDVPIVGISRDDLNTHKKFIREHQIPFELLTDEEGKVCKAYDALIPIVKVPKRLTYLLDQNHQIRGVYQNMFEARKHIEKMLVILNEKQ